MDTSSPDADARTGASRRRSGRVAKKPDMYATSSPTGSAKRKRADAEEGGDIDMEDASEDDTEETEGEPDEEELREKRRKAKKAKKAPRKPTAKKPKTNGGPVSLALRQASGKTSKTKRTIAQNNAAAEEAGGLYAEVFARGRTLDNVAAHWVSQFKEHESIAVADLFNFVLKCAGCDHKIDHHDAEDPDHFTEKLTDIQDEYQAQNITDYPLILRAKGKASFKHTMTGLFHSLIRTLDKSGILYDEEALMENIVAWIGTMSSAANRPFRHTATVAALAIVSSLCEVGKETLETSAKILRQSEGEKKKGRVNKGRISDLDAKVKKAGEKQEKLDNFIKDWFDTVFVHRYRDIDPRIRVDCVQALSDWIITYPDLFFDGHYLRYLGWVLSDTSAPTRLEVVKQLQKLYKDKDKIGGLKTFTERFRARMVEMATRDAEANVRASAVELLDILREAGLLEPDDIDSIGRLIFDAEPRVRRAVIGFFAENVNDLYDSKIEELGGQEALDEALVTVEGDDDFDNPRVEWLKFKCLVEVLQTYDSEDQALPSQIERGPGGTNYTLVTSSVESRFSLAAQALYDQIPEMKQWEVLAGYLLFDHSQIAQDGAPDDPEAMLKQECRLGQRDEIILLEVLNTAVKLWLTEAVEATKDKKMKRTKAQKQLLFEEQETAARHLAALIPQLLNKFGALPDAASAVLRLEHVLNLEAFQELRQDSSTYAALLDDIKKQFLSHGSESVLVEASAALLHAKSYEELGEVTEGKVQALWDDTVNTLHALHKDKDFTVRGNLSTDMLTGVSNTVLRICNLASISDCTEPLEAPPVSTNKGKTKATASSDAVAMLVDIVYRGVPGSDIEPETDALEDILVTNACRPLLFYFMWKVRSWTAIIAANGLIADNELDGVAERRDAFAAALTSVLNERHGADDLRLAVAGTLLDLHTLMTTLRQARPHAISAAAGVEPNEDYLALVLEVEPATQTILQHVLIAAEKAFAKKSRKHVEAGEDDDPIDSDEEPQSDDEDQQPDAEDDAARAEKQHAALIAEQRLCELASKIVLAIIAGVVDNEPVQEEEQGGQAARKEPFVGPLRKLLEKNKTRLGQNYKEVVAFLDAGKQGVGARGGRSKARSKPQLKGEVRGRSKSNVVVEEEDEVDDENANERRVDDDEADEETLRARGLHVEDEIEDDGSVDQNAGRGEEAESVLGD